jgi:hypothetical protein
MRKPVGYITVSAHDYNPRARCGPSPPKGVRVKRDARDMVRRETEMHRVDRPHVCVAEMEMERLDIPYHLNLLGRTTLRAYAIYSPYRPRYSTYRA